VCVIKTSRDYGVSFNVSGGQFFLPARIQDLLLIYTLF